MDDILRLIGMNAYLETATFIFWINFADSELTFGEDRHIIEIVNVYSQYEQVFILQK